jgi:hypothetical protein
LRSGANRIIGHAREAPGGGHLGQIDDLVADRHATAPRFTAATPAKHGERQVLDREISVTVR